MIIIIESQGLHCAGTTLKHQHFTLEICIILGNSRQIVSAVLGSKRFLSNSTVFESLTPVSQKIFIRITYVHNSILSFKALATGIVFQIKNLWSFSSYPSNTDFRCSLKPCHWDSWLFVSSNKIRIKILLLYSYTPANPAFLYINWDFSGVSITWNWPSTRHLYV